MTRVTGLTATELSLALSELRPKLAGATVRDVARIDGQDDLLLFLESASQRLALHIVPGGSRSRVCLTERRFPKALFQTGPLIDRLGQTLRGARFTEVRSSPGERSLHIGLQTGQTAWSLHVELFGARGLWCLADAQERILELSRLPNSKGRELRPGALYGAPAPLSSPAPDPPTRFAPPVLTAIDAFYTEHDKRADEKGADEFRDWRAALSR